MKLITISGNLIVSKDGIVKGNIFFIDEEGNKIRAEVPKQPVNYFREKIVKILNILSK